MKRRLKGPCPTDLGDECDHGDQMFYLDRLYEELEHPDESRRSGARAALCWLSRLVHLRATAADVESLCEPTEEPSVEQEVRRIERAIAAREEAREIALAAGECDLLELLN
jgi:hypothetical protein